MSHTTDVDSVSNDVVAVCTHILPAAAYSLLVSYRTTAEWPLDPLWRLVATSSCSLTSLPSSDISLYQMMKLKHLWLEQYQQAVNHLTSGFLSWNLVPFSSNKVSTCQQSHAEIEHHSVAYLSRLKRRTLRAGLIHKVLMYGYLISLCS